MTTPLVSCRDCLCGEILYVLIDLDDISVSTAKPRNISDNINTAAPGANAGNCSVATFALEVANLDGVSNIYLLLSVFSQLKFYS